MATGKRVSLLSFFFMIAVLVCAQSLNTEWYDSEWKSLPSRTGAAFYRVSSIDSSTRLFLVTDYYSSGNVYRTGAFKSLVPEVRTGKFTWYDAKSNVCKEAIYEGDKLVNPKVFNEEGKVVLSVIMKLSGKNGEEILEPMKVDKEPAFVGGKKALAAFKRKNLGYPLAMKTHLLSGSVLVLFTVHDDGSLTDINLLTTIHPDLDKEALRYVASMPRWSPALVGDIPVTVPYVLSVYFENTTVF